MNFNSGAYKRLNACKQLGQATILLGNQLNNPDPTDPIFEECIGAITVSAALL
jgi:hypothetical protein